MESYQALYYPYVHFKSDDWVKMSALYWDKLKRIVPEGYLTEDSETVQALGSFIQTIRPDAVHSGFSIIFRDFFITYGAQLREKYSVAQRDQWPALSPEQRPSAAGGPSGSDLRLGYVRYEKINDDVHRAMHEYDLASADGRGDPWVGMHPRLASVYMHALAEQIAQHNGLRPLTDETVDHIAMSQLSVERLANVLLGDVKLVGATPSSTEIESALISVAFRTVVPANVTALGVDQIVRFRETFPNERHRFQVAVAGLLKSRDWLSSISDPIILEERLRDEVESNWVAELDELKGKLHSVGIETIWSSANLTTTLPALAINAMGALHLAANSVAVGTASLALAAIPMLLSKRKIARDELSKSSVAYLYKMEQDLQPKDLQSRWRQRMQRFVIGA